MFAIVTVLAAAVVDLFRSRRSLLTEIALLRHQLTVCTGRSPDRA